MSWDVTLYKFNEYPLPAGTDISNMEKLEFGTVAKVRDLISKQLPETVWEAFWTGYYIGNGFRLEFFIGSYKSDENDVIAKIEVVVYGAIDLAIQQLLRLSHPYRWSIQDLDSGALIGSELY